MAHLVVQTARDINAYLDKHADERTTDWPLMSSPFPTIIICLTYVYVTSKLGPKIMSNRKPFKLQKVLIVYNFFQVISNIWIFKECLMSGWFNYSLKCQPIDRSPAGLRMAGAVWWYYISKLTDLADTIFFVMRKKSNQITFLHVYHHAVMPLTAWAGTKIVPGGHGTLVSLLNSFIHIIMYSYYLLAAFGPSVQKYLWWKKHLTAMQMIQFAMIIVHTCQLLFIECDYPKLFVWWILVQAIIFFILFKSFYNKAYAEKQKAL